MTTGKDTASFFENGTTRQFEYCFKLYPQVLKLKADKRSKKPQELIRLDDWYQNELPKLIKARGKDAHMVYDELVQTMKWKQTRGKFYPQLSYLVKVNTPRAVMQETKKAFRKLPNLEQAITALSNLKGVGTTMASALLAAAAPDSAPFMADECLMAIPEIEGIDYTTKEYLNFVQHIQTTMARLNIEAGGETPFWSPHRVELALWAHYVANDLSPELLDEMPGPGAGGGVNTNGNAAATVKVLDGDTTDADEESLGAAIVERGDVTAGNNTATESETENENTNPAATLSAGVLQDGDSNFVSNDSTSQEPLIDENTTQTTATSTSTDDGDDVDGEEVVTPLASDSESNQEAPTAKAAATSIVSDSTVTAAALASNVVAAANVVAPIHAANNGAPAVVLTNAAAATLVVGNGNGTLHAVAGGDSLDGENSNGVQDDADDDEDDDSSSNNTNSLDKSVTPTINNLNDGTNDDSLETTTTLSSNAGAVGQKRALHCDGAEEPIENSRVEPEVKKIRSD